MTTTEGHEKCIFETLHNEMQCILSVKESNFNEKKNQNFHICLRSGPTGLTLTSSLMKGKEGKYLVRRGEEKMKEEKKIRERKGGKYLEEDDIFFFAEEKENRKGYGFFSGGEEKLQMKRRKVLD